MLAGIAVLLVSGALVLGLAWWAQRPAGCGDTGAGSTTAGPVAGAPSSAEEYWTPERMREAKGAEPPGTAC